MRDVKAGIRRRVPTHPEIVAGIARRMHSLDGLEAEQVANDVLRVLAELKVDVAIQLRVVEQDGEVTELEPAKPAPSDRRPVI